MRRFLGRTVFKSVVVAAVIAMTGLSVFAQKKDGTLTCRDNGWYNDKLEGNCEIREQTLAMSGAPIAIDGRQNGGISVKGWDQGQVLVRARVQTGAPTAGEAADLAKQIRIETSGAKIFANGPENRKDYHW